MRQFTHDGFPRFPNEEFLANHGGRRQPNAALPPNIGKIAGKYRKRRLFQARCATANEGHGDARLARTPTR
jgi:hypothetical protein